MPPGQTRKIIQLRERKNREKDREKEREMCELKEFLLNVFFCNWRSPSLPFIVSSEIRAEQRVVNWRQIEKKVASDEGGNGEGMGSS
jgi:hypothetical protein